jgi:hypothetical protein
MKLATSAVILAVPLAALLAGCGGTTTTVIVTSTGSTNTPATSSSTQSTTAPTTSSTAASGSASAIGPVCGTVTGGANDYQGQTLTVHAGSGVSCATALMVIRDLGSGKAQNHPGSDQAQSYLTVDGWTCPYGNMGIQDCLMGGLHIEATAPGP